MQLKVVAIFAVLFALNAFCCFGAEQMALDSQNLWLQCAEAVVRTCLLVGLGVWAVYRWNVSAEVKNLIKLCAARCHVAKK